MNEIAKTNVKERLEKAMETEGLKPSETANIIGIHPNYVSMIKNPNTWDKCPGSVWDFVLLWVNSGQSLKEYFEKHGKFMPVKREVKPEIEIPKVKKEKPIKEIKRETKGITKGNLIDLLLEEKNFLQGKIDAINLLLKHYIS
jgi:hypothetical protein